MNKRGMDLAMSTVVIVIISILVLVGIVYLVTDGFKKFRSVSQPFLDTSEATAVREACKLACINEDKEGFCNRDYDFGKDDTGKVMKLKCSAVYEKYSLDACAVKC